MSKMDGCQTILKEIPQSFWICSKLNMTDVIASCFSLKLFDLFVLQLSAIVSNDVKHMHCNCCSQNKWSQSLGLGALMVCCAGIPKSRLQSTRLLEAQLPKDRISTHWHGKQLPLVYHWWCPSCPRTMELSDIFDRDTKCPFCCFKVHDMCKFDECDNHIDLFSWWHLEWNKEDLCAN